MILTEVDLKGIPPGADLKVSSPSFKTMPVEHVSNRMKEFSEYERGYLCRDTATIYLFKNKSK